MHSFPSETSPEHFNRVFSTCAVRKTKTLGTEWMLLFTPSAIFFVTKFHVFAIMSKATSQAFSSYRRNRTVLSFRERYRLTVFVSNGTVAVMAQRGVSLKSVLTCYEKNKMIFFFIWAVIDFLTINISWFLLNIKQHPSPISRKPQTVLNVWMAWIVCIVLFSYHKCACPMSRAIAATFWPCGRRALRARRPRGPNVKKVLPENVLEIFLVKRQTFHSRNPFY